jgi:hypothetical protein
VPGAARLAVGQTETFAVTAGQPPYLVHPSGGAVVPATVANAGGTFTYIATTVGAFTILVSDTNGAVATATVTNEAAGPSSPAATEPPGEPPL